MFAITMGKGFQIAMPNGWTVSVQFGFGNYCENKNDNTTVTMFGKYSGQVESKDAEIAAWDKDDNWYEFENGKAKGWCSTDEVLDFINEIRAL